MGSPHGFLFVAKQVYHVLNPFFSSFLVQLAETKVASFRTATECSG
jgi:hypothetical protein